MPPLAQIEDLSSKLVHLQRQGTALRGPTFESVNFCVRPLAVTALAYEILALLEGERIGHWYKEY